MREIKGQPLREYTKKIGNSNYCLRNIYSDLIGACPAKKSGKAFTTIFHFFE